MIKTKIDKKRSRQLCGEEKELINSIIKTAGQSKSKILKFAQTYKDCKDYQRELASSCVSNISQVCDDTTNTVIHQMFDLFKLLLDKTVICDYELIDPDNEREVGYLDGQLSYHKEVSNMLDSLSKCTKNNICR
jgi:hypothetical protein